MSCSVPSADVTVKVSVNVSPSPSSWTASRSLFRGAASHAIGACRCWTCRMSLPCRFAPWRSLRPRRHHWSSVCRPCSSWCLPSLPPASAVTRSDDRRVVDALIVTVMSCSVPSADVTVISVNVSPSPEALGLRRGRYSRVRPRHRCRCWTCRMSLPCRFAVVLRPASSSLIVSVPPVLKLVSSVTSPTPTPSPVPMTGASLVPFDRHPWCHALCRLPTSLWRDFVNVSPSPSSWTASGSLFRVRPHAIGADVERAVWACRVGLRREGRFARIVITDRQCAARAQAGVFRHFAASTPSPVPMTGASLVPWSSPWCHALCRLPSTSCEGSVNVSPSPSSWTRPGSLFREYVHTPSVPMLNVPYEPAVSVCAVKGRFARIVITDRQCTARVSWCLPSLRPASTPSPIPMTGASLVPLIVTVMSCSVPLPTRPVKGFR